MVLLLGRRLMSRVIGLRQIQLLTTILRVNLLKYQTLPTILVSDSPTGPFRDAIGKALITNEMTTDKPHSWDDIDPTVFIDDDGQAFLVWGNGSCKIVKLKDNMVELDGDIRVLDIPHFIEGPWIYKRNGLYYVAPYVFSD